MDAGGTGGWMDGEPQEEELGDTALVLRPHTGRPAGAN